MKRDDDMSLVLKIENADASFNHIALFVLVPSTYFAKRIDRRLFLFMIAVETAVYNFVLGIVGTLLVLDFERYEKGPLTLYSI